MDQALIACLDRDGVICRYYPGDYTRRWAEFQFIQGAREALRLLNEAGARVFVVSNQAGVGQGLFTRHDLADIERRMSLSVADSGGRIEGSFYCLHTPEENCSCRKPAAGLIEKAAREHLFDPLRVRGYMVGDTEKDISCGRRMGFVTILVLSGATRFRAEVEGWDERPDHLAEDLLGAIDYII